MKKYYYILDEKTVSYMSTIRLPDGNFYSGQHVTSKMIDDLTTISNYDGIKLNIMSSVGYCTIVTGGNKYVLVFSHSISPEDVNLTRWANEKNIPMDLKVTSVNFNNDIWEVQLYLRIEDKHKHFMEIKESYR